MYDSRLQGVAAVVAPTGADYVLALVPDAGRVVVVREGEGGGGMRRRLFEL